jgi:TRAP-type C4-dicarboxylate transport system permease small subunit
VLFWALAFIVFLQFFTRYILNDSLPGPRRSRATG